MDQIIRNVAARGLVVAATLLVATTSGAESVTVSDGSAGPETVLAAKADLRVPTDGYLVPAHICPDVEAEKYEDCVPWSHVGENVLVILPEPGRR